MYQWGSVLHLSPADIDAMPMWKFNAYLDGHNLVNGGKHKAEQMSDTELAALNIEGF